MSNLKFVMEIIWSFFFYVPLVLWYTKAHKLRRVEILVIEIGLFLLSGALYITSDHENDMIICSTAIVVVIGMLIPARGSWINPPPIHEARREEISVLDDIMFCFFYTTSYFQLHLPIFCDPLTGYK